MTAHDAGGDSTRGRPRPPSPWRWLVSGISLVLVVGAVSVGLTWIPTTGSAARAAAESTSRGHHEPGADPRMQQWTASRAAHEIALNNALALVLARSSGSTRLVHQPCTAARAEVKALLAQTKAPDDRVDRLARAGLRDIYAGTQSCLKGDKRAALAQIRSGLTARQEVRNDLDEAYEGEE